MVFEERIKTQIVYKTNYLKLTIFVYPHIRLFNKSYTHINIKKNLGGLGFVYNIVDSTLTHVFREFRFIND